MPSAAVVVSQLKLNGGAVQAVSTTLLANSCTESGVPPLTVTATPTVPRV